MDKPRNIFEAILQGLETTNQNIVDVSVDIVALREDVALIKTMLQPPEVASVDDKKATKSK